MSKSDYTEMRRSVTRGLLRSFRIGFGLPRLCMPSQHRDVLLCCNMPLAADYLGSFWRLFRQDPRLRFRVLATWPLIASHCEEDIAHVRTRLPVPETHRFWAYARPWDLTVCSDHCLNGEIRPKQAIFIGHGPHNKSYNGGMVTYTYGQSIRDGKGRFIYTRIFEERETNREQALQADPSLKDIIAVVGSLENDRLLEQSQRREEFRRRMGYERDDVVVFVLSTWGESCLLHTMGVELLEQARRLQSEFKFIFSAHPHEYRPRTDGGRVWGEYLRSQKAQGFAIREPSEDWIPYMVASDIVVSDHTGLVEPAALLEKPIIVVPVPDGLIWKHSATWQIRRFAPTLHDATMLRDCLYRVKTDYPYDELHELAQTLNPYPGEAATRIRKEVYALLGIPPAPVSPD